VRVGVADLALDDGSHKIASRSDREAAEAHGTPLKRLRDPVYAELLSDVWARERADGLRLDYVAVTRARDRLTIVAADPRGKWPLELSHLRDAIAAAEQRHPNAVAAITGRVSTSTQSCPSNVSSPWDARTPIEVSRPLTPLPISATRLEGILDAD
jgi:ATP-dependent exoDNAse (exonuclease V) beta subunit